MSTQTFLVSGASGNIGRPLISILAKEGVKVVALTTNAKKLQDAIGSEPRIEVEEGAISDPKWVQEMIGKHSVSAAFVNIGGTDEFFTTYGFLDACQLAGVKHVVYLSGLPGPAEWQCANGYVKTVFETKLQSWGDKFFSWTCICPTQFTSNDENVKGLLLEKNVYAIPQPKMNGVSRVHPEDIALAAKNALIDLGKQYHGQMIGVGTLKAYTADEMVAIWGKALGGKTIYPNYATPESLAQYEEAMRSAVGPAYARAVSAMYTMFGEQGWKMTEEQYKQQVKLLGGKEPRTYEVAVDEMVKKWST